MNTKSIDYKRGALSSSQTRMGLSSSMVRSRMPFNGNFTSKNSKAKGFVLFQTGNQITNDFDPKTVFDGIQDIEYENDELEENIDAVLDGENEALEEEISNLIENNKKLIIQVNEVAEIVSKGVRKAATIKKTKLMTSHRDQTESNELNERRTKIYHIQGQIAKAKRKILNLKSEFEIISR